MGVVMVKKVPFGASALARSMLPGFGLEKDVRVKGTSSSLCFQ